jgi:hypothetical protein
MTNKFWIIFLAVLLNFKAIARSPAVEDFVGIEVEETKVIPDGSEVFFNLEKDVKNISENSLPQPKGITTSQKESRDIQILVLFLAVLSLPAFLWWQMMAKLKKNLSLIEKENVHDLKSFRDQKDKNQDIDRKAS